MKIPDVDRIVKGGGQFTKRKFMQNETMNLKRNLPTFETDTFVLRTRFMEEIRAAR